MAETLTRRKIVRACKSRGWILQATALAAIHKHFNDTGVNALEDELDRMAAGAGKGAKLITEAMWLETLESEEGIVGGTAAVDFETVNAMATPRLVYDSMRKTFQVETKRWSLLGDAADKINMMAQRYALMHQRLLRHDTFRKKTASYQANAADRETQHSLTPIESLLGKSNSDQVSVLVLGILVQVEEGKFYLEDTTGRVEVSFENATAVNSCYVTENAIFLVEATFRDDILHVDIVALPFLEQREKSLQMLQQQVRNPHFLPVSKDLGTDANTPFVVLSDVHLDQPRVLTWLEKLFSSYESQDDPANIPVFCLMGNFSSGSDTQFHQGWEELATILAKFPTLSEHGHFVFIPGPNDTRMCILPQQPVVHETIGLQRMMESYQIQNVHWGSNPTRIRQNGKEILLFRHDTLSWILQNQIRLHQNDDLDESTPHSRMMKTILHQGHLLPVANAPIYWNYDHALRLYPLPDALIMGDSASSAEDEIYEECHAVHPGSFSRDGTYSIYHPTYSPDGEDDDDMSVEPGSRVEVCQVDDSEA